MVPRICKSPYQSRHNKRLAEAEAGQQGSDDENDMQTRHARRNARNIAPRHEQDDDSQARQARRPHETPLHTMSKTTTAIRKPHNHVGKRNGPMKAKAQLLQGAAHDRNTAPPLPARRNKHGSVASAQITLHNSCREYIVSLPCSRAIPDPCKALARHLQLAAY
ncbi:hypothetical protein BCR37DRAFT_42667 [Protomyces lactucae-debilis]|uniref:Uncharacterized protein n=1 Tax=Protomyces lactucae-debilis TaxID=2754530 RepID=A0A1Y2FBV3_PROLT|nr:uncharacterized protein BCR37DRAFT_42667 [Protomyces lactucae-debilis]ORY81383.1 hypothetical protein BCR37DRAFT_42667 [Protomyces lactucae-debilis]